MKKSGRLTRAGLHLVACFKFNAETKKVEFKGLAFDYAHASTVITGDKNFANCIGALCAGKAKKFRHPNTNWYCVSIEMPYNKLVDPDEVTKFVFEAKNVAEIKLAAIYAMSGTRTHFGSKKNPFLVKDNDALTDALKDAFRHINSDIPQMTKPVITPTTDLKVEEEFDDWNIFATPDEEQTTSHDNEL